MFIKINPTPPPPALTPKIKTFNSFQSLMNLIVCNKSCSTYFVTKVQPLVENWSVSLVEY